MAGIVPIIPQWRSREVGRWQQQTNGDRQRHRPRRRRRLQSRNYYNETHPTLFPISSSSYLPERFHQICHRLANNDPLVTTLNLKRKGIRDGGVKAIAKALQSNWTLTELDLSDNDIGDEGVVALAHTALHHSLQKLHLDYNHVGSEGAKALGTALASKHSSLKKLCLCVNHIGNEGAAALADGIQHNNGSLQSLCLRYNRFSNDAAKAFGDTFAKSNNATTSALKKLELSANAIGDEGAIALAEGLAHNNTSSSVEYLELGCNLIGNDGAKAWASCLKTNTSLKALYLEFNDISHEGVKAIVRDGLVHYYTIRTVELGEIQDKQLQSEMNFYLLLNRTGGRRLLRAHDVPDSLWVHVFAKVGNNPDLLFYFIQANPQLFKR